MFELKIHTDNDAFQPDDEARADETARLLREVAERVAHDYSGGVIVDANGTRVGSFEFTSK